MSCILQRLSLSSLAELTFCLCVSCPSFVSFTPTYYPAAVSHTVFLVLSSSELLWMWVFRFFYCPAPLTLVSFSLTAGSPTSPDHKSKRQSDPTPFGFKGSQFSLSNKYKSSVLICIFPVTNLNAVYRSALHLLCGAFMSTWVALSQIGHCLFCTSWKWQCFF